MAYGLRTRASASNAILKRALERAGGSWGGFQAWRPLDVNARLELVERALQCANDDCTDGYPAAL
jgi:hypothetical protein